MKFKRIMVLFLAIVTMFAVAACKKDGAEKTDGKNDAKPTTEATKSPGEDAGAEPTEEAKEPVTLRMAWWGSQTRHDRTIEVINMYMDQNPHVTIEYEFYDFDGYFTKLNTLVASNEVWDCFQLGGNFPTYISKVLPLNDFIDAGIIDTSNTTEAFLKTTRSDGIQVGLSNGVNCYGVAYDPQMFADAGVPEPTENWTWDEWKNACLTIHEKLGIFGSSKLDDFIAGCSSGVPQSQKDLSFFAMSNDKLGFDDYTLLTDYIQLRADLVAAGAYPDPGAIAEIKDIEGDYLVTGEAAMTWVASNQFIALSDAAGRELKLVPLPRKYADGSSGSAIQSSQMFCVSQDSKNPEEAAKFLSFFWTDEEANKILAGERGISIHTNVIEAQKATMTEQQAYVNDFVNLIGSFEVGEVNVISPPQWQIIKDQHDLTIQKVIYGEMTADQAAKDFYEFAKAQFE